MNWTTFLERARARRWLGDCERVGRGASLHGRPSVTSYRGHIRIGDRLRLASLPVPSHLIAADGGVLEIGDDVAIAHGAAIAAYGSIRIGSDTCIGPYAIIMDTNFHRGAGERSLHHETQPVVIGGSCRIGSRVTIVRGATIGDGAEILAGSVVLGAIPPHARAAGAPARVIGVAGEPLARIRAAAPGADPGP